MSNEAVIVAVRAGRRLDEVRGTPAALAMVMYECTQMDRKSRPTFAELAEVLDELVLHAGLDNKTISGIETLPTLKEYRESVAQKYKQLHNSNSNNNISVTAAATSDMAPTMPSADYVVMPSVPTSPGAEDTTPASPSQILRPRPDTSSSGNSGTNSSDGYGSYDGRSSSRAVRSNGTASEDRASYV